jgi:hypothetical protein
MFCFAEAGQSFGAGVRSYSKNVSLQEPKKIIINNFYKDKITIKMYQRTLDRFAGKYKQLAREITKYGIGAVIFSFDINRATKDKDYANKTRAFVSEMHKNRIFVHAMFIQNEEVLDNSILVRDRITKLIAFQKQSKILEKFDGINIDVEPERTLLWKESKDNRNALVEKLINVMQVIRQELNKEKGRLVFSADGYAYYMKDMGLQPHFQVGKPSDFLQYIDVWILMAYDDDAKDIIDAVDDEIDETDKQDSIMVCLKTKDNDGDGTTFAQEGKAVLNSSIEEINTYFQSSMPYVGIGIFEYDSYIEMMKK